MPFAAHLFVVLFALGFILFYSVLCAVLGSQSAELAGPPQLVVYEKTMCSVAREKR